MSQEETKIQIGTTRKPGKDTEAHPERVGALLESYWWRRATSLLYP